MEPSPVACSPAASPSDCWPKPCWTGRPSASTSRCSRPPSSRSAGRSAVAGERRTRVDAWLPVVAMVLAAFVAVRGDPFLALLDAAGSAAFIGRVAGRDVRAGGHPAIGFGGRDDGGLDARIGRRGRGQGRRRRAAHDRRAAAARPGAREVVAARAPACHPDRPDLPDPVRLGRPDLRTLAGRHRRLAGGSREPVRAAAVHRVVCVAGGGPAVGGGVGDPGRRAVVARRRGPDRGRPAAGRSARGHRGAGRPAAPSISSSPSSSGSRSPTCSVGSTRSWRRA